MVPDSSGADLGGGCRGCAPSPPLPRDDLQFSNTTGILPKKTMWFIELEMSAPLPKKNPGSAPVAIAATGKSYRIGHLFTQGMNFPSFELPNLYSVV